MHPAGPSATKGEPRCHTRRAPPGKPLVLAHHMDVVPAVAEDWDVESLCRRAARRLRLRSWRPRHEGLRRPHSRLCARDQAGWEFHFGGHSAFSPRRTRRWAVSTARNGSPRTHLDDVGGEFLLTEGSFARAGPRATYYAVQTAEKGVSTIKLTARGQPGHASAPRDDNAIIRIARAVARLAHIARRPRLWTWRARFLSAFPPGVLGLGGGRNSS